jgi:hypothetical protein
MRRERRQSSAGEVERVHDVAVDVGLRNAQYEMIVEREEAHRRRAAGETVETVGHVDAFVVLQMTVPDQMTPTTA